MSKTKSKPKLRLSLRAKFYLLMLPLVATIIALLVILVLPAGKILDRVDHIRVGVSEVLSAEKFQMLYSRQLREFAVCLANGARDTSGFDAACQAAGKALSEWTGLVEKQDFQYGPDPGIRLEDQDSIKKDYEQFTGRSREALELMRKGDTETAMDVAITEVELSDFGRLSITVDSLIIEMNGMLQTDLHYLSGTIDGSVLLRMMRLESYVWDVVARLSNLDLTRQFAFLYERQVKKYWDLIMIPLEENEEELDGYKLDAEQQLSILRSQITDLSDPVERIEMEEIINGLEGEYDNMKRSGERVVQLAREDDQSGALQYARKNMAPLAFENVPKSIDELFAFQEENILEDLGHIDRGTRRIVWIVGLLAGFILLLGIGIPWLLSRKIVRPVLKLKDAAVRFGSGDLDTKVDVSSRDEFGELATTFNEMAQDRKEAEEELKKARDELEVRVEERTSELAAANEALENINRELEGYAHTVSHDLKGPLTVAIMGTSSLQRTVKGEDLEQQRAYISGVLEAMADSMEQSKVLIDGLLALAEAGQTPKEVFEVDVSDVVDRILDERSGEIIERSIEMEVDPALGSVLADPTHIYQLFSNLVGNAIRHNDSTQPTIEISRLEDERVGIHRYLVRDNGSGIPPDDLDRVFTPFYKVKQGGTGIGLATVLKVISVYDGGIRAFNQDGACFEFYIKDYGKQPPGKV